MVYYNIKFLSISLVFKNIYYLIRDKNSNHNFFIYSLKMAIQVKI